MIALVEMLKLNQICLIIQQKDSKKASEFDTSNLAVKSDLASLKAEIDKIDVDKLKTVPVDSSKLNNAVDNNFNQMTVYDKLAANVNAIHTNGCVLRSKYDTDKSDLEKEINDTDKKYLIIVDMLKKTD